MTEVPKKSPGSAEEDPLLRQARLLKERAERENYIEKKEHRQSRIGRLEKQVTDIHETLEKAGQTYSWMNKNILKPAGGVLGFLFGKATRNYKKLWDRVSYIDDGYGKRDFSPKRAGVMVAGSLMAAFVLVSAAGPVLQGTGEFVWDAGWMASTYREGTIYMHNAQEILPEKNIHSAQGCEKLPCTDQDSIYYRIKPTLLHHLWSLADNGNIFFADYVAAAIPPGYSKCDYVGYGTRMKMMVRNMETYPYLLKVTCRPVDISLELNLNAQ